MMKTEEIHTQISDFGLLKVNVHKRTHKLSNIDKFHHTGLHSAVT